MQHILGSIWARKKAGAQIETYAFAAAALAALSVGAHARDDRLPANFVGNWCLAEPTADDLAFYRRGRCASSDHVGDWLTVSPDSFDVHEMHGKLLGARANKRGDISESSGATTI